MKTRITQYNTHHVGQVNEGTTQYFSIIFTMHKGVTQYDTHHVGQVNEGVINSYHRHIFVPQCCPQHKATNAAKAVKSVCC